MNRWRVLLAVGAAIPVTGCGLALDDGASADGERFIHAETQVPGQYIVVLRDKTIQAEAAENDVADLADSSQGEVFAVYQHALHGYAARMTEAEARALLDDRRVAFVEEDGVVHASTVQGDAVWGIDRVDQHDLPLSTTYSYITSGAGVNVYVIDTGIRTTHSEFLTAQGGSTRAVGVFTAVGDGNGSDDCNGHGTHVAGTIGGLTYGVAKGVNLYSVRVLDCDGYGTTSGVISGVDWVAQYRERPAVANMSLGGGVSEALDQAVANAIQAGVTFAVAAGNDDANACKTSPARQPDAITVGATRSSDERASYSNYGPCLDIFAPGSTIKSSWNTSDTATKVISGTSMASPHVAGAAALYLAGNPTATPQEVRDALVNKATSDAVTGPGSGSPNKLLYTASLGGTPDTTAPSTTITTPASGSTVSGTVTIAVDASDAVGVTSIELYVDGTRIAYRSASPSLSVSWNSATVVDGYHTLTAKAYDADGNIGTSADVPVSVTNGTDGSCTSQLQLLANPGFESGEVSWTASAGVIDSSVDAQPYAGSWKAWLDGYGAKHTDTLYQSVTIPASACNATLSFWLYVSTFETTDTKPFDTLTVDVQDSSGAVLGTLGTYSNLNATGAYEQEHLDLTAYKGQTVRVSFGAVEDSSLQTTFLIDNALLMVTL